MSLQDTPQSERLHIAVFGRRNAGKSSLLNAITDQNVSIVSAVKGTTTDPVRKTMELLPLGPVLFTDTPGLDDEGELGALRVQRTYDILNQTDIAIVVAGADTGFGDCEEKLIAQIRAKKLPFAAVLNKIDLLQPGSAQPPLPKPDASGRVPPLFRVSSITHEGINELKMGLTHLMPDDLEGPLVGDLLKPGDVLVEVIPIDAAAPKGRLILPEQQVLRGALDIHAMVIVTQPQELRQTLAALAKPPKLVVCDSQAFAEVKAALPPDQPLISFSILYARYKGDIAALLSGARALATLKDGDRILIAEGCTHHRQADDIGTVKIPRGLLKFTGKKLVFEHSHGISYPRDLKDYKLIIHCGGCMLNRREILYRIRQAREAGVPITNYGVLLATLQGILPRTLQPLGLQAE